MKEVGKAYNILLMNETHIFINLFIDIIFL
jgi:hypothetical protein